MAKLLLEMVLNNDAFKEDKCGEEIARILREIAEECEIGCTLYGIASILNSKRPTDTNGNPVAKIRVTGAKKRSNKSGRNYQMKVIVTFKKDGTITYEPYNNRGAALRAWRFAAKLSTGRMLGIQKVEQWDGDPRFDRSAIRVKAKTIIETN